MAEINVADKGRTRLSKTTARSLRVDMTPMVDLGFLLITFFIFTAVIDKPKAMNLILPVDGDPTSVPVTKTLTILLHENKAICYEGFINNNPYIQTVNMAVGTTDLRKVIFAKQKALSSAGVSSDSLVVVIRPGDNSNYQQLVAVLDEMMICGVKKHALGKLEEAERNLLNDKP